MRIPRFYTSVPLATDATLDLSPELFRHAIQVLRMKQGEPLILFNGDGGEYHGEIHEISKRRATVSIHSFDPVERESPLPLTLVQSIIKPDKMDFAIQKSVELGVTAIRPLITQRSVVRMGRDKLDKKMNHWQAVAVSACEQSGRTRVPDILPVLTLDSWLARGESDSLRLFLMPGGDSDVNELSVKDVGTSCQILIGPEGGLAEIEAEQCLQQGIIGVSLGPRILRAETAALAIIALLQQHFGDMRH